MQVCGELAVSWERTKCEAGQRVVHACRLPRGKLNPSGCYGISVAWSEAQQEVHVVDEQRPPTGLIEQRATAARLMGAGQPPNVVLQRKAGRLRTFVSSNTGQALACPNTPSVRSFISIRTRLFRPRNADLAASTIADASQVAVSECERASGEQPPWPVQAKRFRLAGEGEPYFERSPALALGINVSEVLVCWRVDKTRKANFAMVQLLPADPKEAPKDIVRVGSSEPLPFLPLVDVEVEILDSQSRAAVGLHVCGHQCVRVVDALRALVAAHPREETALRQAQTARAALLASFSQASLVSELACSLRSGHANVAIASSKRIGIADVSTLLLLTPYDAYVAGFSNVQCSFANTPYVGAYGPRVDTGISPAGLDGRNMGSDSRQHGNLCLTPALVDEMTAIFAERYWVVEEGEEDEQRGGPASAASACRNKRKAGGKGMPLPPPKRRFYAAPPSARGVPHGLVAGVHAALDDYDRFLEAVRKECALPSAARPDTVDCIAVLPFSPWSQCLPPDAGQCTEAAIRTSHRDPTSVATGRAHICDATREEDAIVREPLFRRPSEVACSDNPFCTSYEYVGSFFNCAATLGLYARTLHDLHPRKKGAAARSPASDLRGLRLAIDALVRGEPLPCVAAVLAADALVLLNLAYPSCTSVSELALDDDVALLPALVARKAKEGEGESAVVVAPARGRTHFWKPFSADGCRTRAQSAWSNGIAPLAETLLYLGGRHDVDDEWRQRVRTELETAVRAAWLAASEDGTAPPLGGPFKGVKTPEHVGRRHIDPVFVSDARPEGEEEGLVDARPQSGAAIGAKSCALRQVAALLLGSFLPAAGPCNVANNEGGLSLRVSADPTILDSRGRPRTEKAVSPVQRESDWAAFGSREAKLKGAVAQRKAWDANTRLLLPVMSSLRPPFSEEKRFRGQLQTESRREDPEYSADSCAKAEKMLDFASCSPLPAMVEKEWLGQVGSG